MTRLERVNRRPAAHVTFPECARPALPIAKGGHIGTACALPGRFASLLIKCWPAGALSREDGTKWVNRRLLRAANGRLIADREFVAAFGTTAGQYFTAIGCLHAFAKAMNCFAAAAMRLKCAFHSN